VVFRLGVETGEAGKLEGHTLALACSKRPKGPKSHDQDELETQRGMAEMRPACPDLAFNPNPGTMNCRWECRRDSFAWLHLSNRLVFATDTTRLNS
jgi:hypothetical protein